MNDKLLTLSIVLFLISACKTQMDVTPEKVRQVRPKEVSGFHTPIQLNIAWYPYKDLTLKRTGDNQWKVVQGDSSQSGEIPVILITYPDSRDSLWLEMNTSNELLGRLIKHSLMTQMPIQEPIGNFLEAAKCQSCHPAEIEADLR